ncbi:MAG: hypothetical protein PHV95_03950 [Eubacteriales bacterium]|nr:hypothetical protein [Eubacteriales bacterium]
MNIRPTKPVERLYFYAQSQQLKMQCGSIGYLRGDFDSSGNMFHTTWFDHRESHKTEEFKAELDKIINTLRYDEQYGGLLSNRSTMSEFCQEQKESVFEGNYCTEYGFRVDTENHAYLIRCNPSQGDYNFYVFCYISKWLDNHMKNAEKGIRFIDPNYNEQFRINDGEKIIITRSDGENLSKTCRYIDETHLEVGKELYHICQFAELMERNDNICMPEYPKLPVMCYSTLPSTGELIVIKRGENGYRKADHRMSGCDSSRSYADMVNKKLGVSKAQEAAMIAGSLYGWNVPAADPKNYDTDGHPIKNKNRERER